MIIVTPLKILLVFPMLKYLCACDWAHRAATFSFHPLQFVARAVTAACTGNCFSAGCLLFLTVPLLIVFGRLGLLLPSSSPVVMNHLIPLTCHDSSDLGSLIVIISKECIQLHTGLQCRRILDP